MKRFYFRLLLDRLLTSFEVTGSFVFWERGSAAKPLRTSSPAKVSECSVISGGARDLELFTEQ
jgi:hypothetical protein